MSRLKATYNRNTNKPAIEEGIEEGVATQFHYLKTLDIEGDIFGGPIPPKHQNTAAAIMEEQQELGMYDGGVYRDAVKLAKTRIKNVDAAVAWSLIKHGFRLLAGLSDSKAVDELEKMMEPVQVKNKGAKGSHNRRRALLRPKWVNVSQAARVLGIQRSTILKWHKAGQVFLPGDGEGTNVIKLCRKPAGDVNLTILQYITEHKRALPAPGRRLGGSGSRDLVAAATRAHSSPEHAANYSRTCKALSLLEKVQDQKLLQAVRRSINRLILRRRRA